MDRYQNTGRKVVRPVVAAGQELGEEKTVLEARLYQLLQGAEIQELNSEVKPGEPVLKLVQRDTCVLIHGKEVQPTVACVKEVLWNGSEVDLKVNELPRLKEFQVATGISNMRHVIYTEEVTIVPAKRVLHPCKVFFLPNDMEPMTVALILANKTLRPRPGYICWRLLEKEKSAVTPFQELEPASPAFPEILRLIRLTHEELKLQEEAEGVPLTARTGPLFGHFADSSTPNGCAKSTADDTLSGRNAKKARQEISVGPRGSASLRSAAQKSSSGAAQRSAARKTEPKVAASKGSAAAVESTLGSAEHTLQRTAASLSAATAAPPPLESVEAAPGKGARSTSGQQAPTTPAIVTRSISAIPAPAVDASAAASAGNAVSTLAAELVGGVPPAPASGSKVATQPSAEAASIEKAAVSLVSAISLGDCVHADMAEAVAVLLKGAGPLAQVVSLTSEKTTGEAPAPLEAMRKLVHMPRPATVQSVAKAYSFTSPVLQEHATQLGLYRILGSWLCALQPPEEGLTLLALLKALPKARCSPATVAWITQCGIFDHVVRLTRTGEGSIKERATALKVYWEDEIDKGGAAEEAWGPLPQVTLSQSVHGQAEKGGLPVTAPESEGGSIADAAARGEGGDAARPSEKSSSLRNLAMASGNTREPELPPEDDSAPAAEAEPVERSATPISYASPKMRDLNEIHKTSPSTTALASPPGPLPGRRKSSGPVEAAPGSSRKEQGEASLEASLQPPEVANSLDSNELQDCEWTVAEIRALQNALSEEDMRVLQAMQSISHTPGLDGKVHSFIKEKLKQYKIRVDGVPGLDDEPLQADKSEQTAGKKRPRSRKADEKSVKAKTAGTPFTRSARKQSEGAGQSSHNHAAIEFPAAAGVCNRETAAVEAAQSLKIGAESSEGEQPGNQTEAVEEEPKLQIKVFVVSGKRRSEGLFDVKKMTVLKDGQELTPEQFIPRSQKRKKAWQLSIMVEDDTQGRSIGEWLIDRCSHCELPTDEANLLMCSNSTCEKMYHIYCLSPPLKELPGEEEDWYCPQCNGKKKC